jgi:hypothetical protein
MFSQIIDPSGLANSGWANATIGGVCVALLIVLAFFLKLWVDERKANTEVLRETSAQLVGVIDKTNQVIAGNTQAIGNVAKQTDAMVFKVDDLRESMMRRPCLMQPDVTYRQPAAQSQL